MKSHERTERSILGARGDRGSRRHRCLCWPSANACLSMWNTCACSTLPRYFRTSNKKRATNPSVDTANFANEFDDGAATPLVDLLIERASVKRSVHFISSNILPRPEFCESIVQRTHYEIENRVERLWTRCRKPESGKDFFFSPRNTGSWFIICSKVLWYTWMSHIAER